jgi:mannosyltransferase OCH1-like enzyme
MPPETVRCIDTWKKVMPEYELVLWDKNKFDVNSVIFAREACGVKKWAFAADYIRLFVIYTEGGIYLDTDVYVKKVLTIY